MSIDETDAHAVVDKLSLAIRFDPFSGMYIKIDVEAVAVALAGLTPAVGREVKKVYKQKHNDRDLGFLLSGQAGKTNLNKAQMVRLRNLLAGTAGVTQEARRSALNADLAALHDALRRGPSSHDAVFEILERAPAPGGVALEEPYRRFFQASVMGDIITNLYGSWALPRALALYQGNRTRAAALAIEEQVAKKQKAKEAERKAQEALKADVGLLGALPLKAALAAAAAKKHQREADAATEEQLEQLRGGEGASPALHEVLATPASSGKGTVKDAMMKAVAASPEAERVQAAIIKGDGAEIQAAQLVRLENEGRINRNDVEAALNSLRKTAEKETNRWATLEERGGGAPTEQQSAVKLAEVKEHLFTEFERLFDRDVRDKKRTLRKVIGSISSDVERERNKELLEGRGTLSLVKEIELAILSKDMKRIRAAFADKTTSQLSKLAADYKASTNRSLRNDLLGDPAFQSVVAILGGEHAERQAEKSDLLSAGTKFDSDSWADEASQLRAEAAWTYQRLTALHSRVMNNRGAFAKLHDWAGHVEHDLVERAFRDTWKTAHIDLPVSLGAKDLTKAREQIEVLKRLRIRFEHNVEVYKESSAEAFDAFVDLAVFAVTTLVTLPAGGPVIAAIRSIAGTVGTKFILKGADYRPEEFYKDVLGSAASALGGHLATKAVDKLAPAILKAAQRAKLPVPAQLVKAATAIKSVAVEAVSTPFAQIATGQSVTLPIPEDFFMALAQEGVQHAAGPRRDGKGDQPARAKPGDARGTAEQKLGSKTVGPTAEGAGTVKAIPAHGAAAGKSKTDVGKISMVAAKNTVEVKAVDGKVECCPVQRACPPPRQAVGEKITEADVKPRVEASEKAEAKGRTVEAVTQGAAAINAATRTMTYPQLKALAEVNSYLPRGGDKILRPSEVRKLRALADRLRNGTTAASTAQAELKRLLQTAALARRSPPHSPTQAPAAPKPKPKPKPKLISTEPFVRRGVKYKFTGSKAAFDALRSSGPTRFQVYEIRNSAGKTIYVGVSGGESEPRNSLIRLKEHLTTKSGEFIGNADSIHIRGADLDERVARGFEDNLIDEHEPFWNNRERDKFSYRKEYGTEPSIEEVRRANNAYFSFKVRLLP